MKLHKDGTIEGTPEEIAQYHRYMSEKKFSILPLSAQGVVTSAKPDNLLLRTHTVYECSGCGNRVVEGLHHYCPGKTSETTAKSYDK